VGQKSKGKGKDDTDEIPSAGGRGKTTPTQRRHGVRQIVKGRSGSVKGKRFAPVREPRQCSPSAPR